MKLSNKGVLHPSQEKKWKDTLYRNLFYIEYETIVDIDTIMNVKNYQILIPDTRFTDGKYIYISTFYEPGKRMYRVMLDSTKVQDQ